MTKTLSSHATISPEDAELAIYIDFEGFEGKSPALLGVLIGDSLEQIILDPELRLAAHAKGLRTSSLIQEAVRLRTLSTDQERLIVAYSQHERNLLVTYAQLDIGHRYR